MIYSNYNGESFEGDLKNIKEELNKVSLVIAHEGYAAATIHLDKNHLEDYKFFIVQGTQVEGKQLGATYAGDNRDFKEIKPDLS